ncbi:MAG: hypothetical protein JST93_09900 [Acidobacteria bacterium]|nr:hypothetical protein [Acidobacteriota bacterium]
MAEPNASSLSAKALMARGFGCSTNVVELNFQKSIRGLTNLQRMAATTALQRCEEC